VFYPILSKRVDTVFWLTLDKYQPFCYYTLSWLITCRHDKHGVSTVDTSGPCDSICPFFETSCLQIIGHDFFIPDFVQQSLPNPLPFLLLAPLQSVHLDQYQLNISQQVGDNEIHNMSPQQNRQVAQGNK
jgi:hypothetical protein